MVGREKIEDKAGFTNIYTNMNKEEFKKLISESMESKLREILPSVLDEYFSTMSQSKVKSMTEVSEGPRRQLNSAPAGARPAPPAAQKTTKIQYAKDPILNALLNETVSKIPSEGPAALSGQSQSGPSVMDKIDEIPDSVARVLTRDYSQVLKLSAEKGKNR